MAGAFKPTDCIFFAVENPKRRGSSAFDRYEKYKVAKTVQQAFDYGACQGDLAHDEKKGFLSRGRQAQKSEGHVVGASSASVSASSSAGAPPTRRSGILPTSHSDSTRSSRKRSTGKTCSTGNVTNATNARKITKITKKNSSGCEYPPVNNLPRRRLTKKTPVKESSIARQLAARKIKQKIAKAAKGTIAAKKLHKVSDEERGFRLFFKRYRLEQIKERKKAERLKLLESRKKSKRVDEESAPVEESAPIDDKTLMENCRTAWLANENRSEVIEEALNLHAKLCEKQLEYKKRGPAFSSFSRQLLGNRRKQRLKDVRKFSDAVVGWNFPQSSDLPCVIPAPPPADNDELTRIEVAWAGTVEVNGFYTRTNADYGDGKVFYTQDGEGGHAICFYPPPFVSRRPGWYILRASDGLPMYFTKPVDGSEHVDNLAVPFSGWKVGAFGHEPAPELEATTCGHTDCKRLLEFHAPPADPAKQADATLEVMRELHGCAESLRRKLIAKLLEHASDVVSFLANIEGKSSDIQTGIQFDRSRPGQDYGYSFFRHFVSHKNNYPLLLAKFLPLDPPEWESEHRQVLVSNLEAYNSELTRALQRSTSSPGVTDPNFVLGTLDLSIDKAQAEVDSERKMKTFSKRVKRMTRIAKEAGKVHDQLCELFFRCKPHFLGLAPSQLTDCGPYPIPEDMHPAATSAESGLSIELGERRVLTHDVIVPTTHAALCALSGVEPSTLFDALASSVCCDSDATEWLPLLEEPSASEAMTDGVKSFQECAEMWRNVDRVLVNEFVTKTYKEWIQAGRPLNQVAPSPFGQHGTAGTWWYCENCCNWFEKIQKERHINCGVLGGKAKMFGPQSVGESFAMKLRFPKERASGENSPVQITISGSLSRIAARLNWASFWAADQTQTSYRFVRHTAEFSSVQKSISDGQASEAAAEVSAMPDDTGTTELVENSADFSLASCSDVACAESPCGFRLPLYIAQRRTLAWMVSRETQATEYLSRETLRRRCLETDIDVEVRVERHWQRVRGGILADSVGYGKTACLIGLVCDGLRIPFEKILSNDERRYLETSFFLSNATLVITPPNLYEQWLREFQKFLEPDIFSNMRIIEIPHVQRLQRLTVEDLANADVVIIPYRFFFSVAYEKYFDDVIKRDREELPQKGGKRAENGRQEAQRYAVMKDYILKLLGATASETGLKHMTEDNTEVKRTTACGQVISANILECGSPLLESFFWRRVVFDEFHEVLGIRQGRPYYALRQIFAKYHWGLTATPCLKDASAVSDMASLLHISVPPCSVPEAQHFLDEWVRSSSWDTSSVPLENRIVDVRHTKQERLLYLHERSLLLRKVVHSSFHAEERLLQLCSHHSPNNQSIGESSAETAVVQRRDELHGELASRRIAVQEAETQLFPLQRRHDATLRLRAAFQAAGLPSMDRDSALSVKDAKRFAKEYDTDDLERIAERLESFLPLVTSTSAAGMPINQKPQLQHTEEISDDENIIAEDDGPDDACESSSSLCLSPDSSSGVDLNNFLSSLAGVARRVRKRYYKPKILPTGRELESQISAHKTCIEQNQKTISELESSTRFFDNALRCLESDCVSGFECPVCLEDGEAGPLAITRCGHVFHESCIGMVVDEQHHCPTCRVPLNRADFSLVQHAVDDTKTDDAHITEGSAPTHGSKLEKILETLREVHAAEPGAKIIIFSQWERVLRFIAQALSEQGEPPPLVLRGTMLQRQEILRNFTGSSDPKHSVLLLSLEQSPTGMNLVCCHHLFLVHPFFARSKERAVACELQAIGRLRRQGQPQTVIVHRFVTKGTIEEEITNRHQMELEEVAQREGQERADHARDPASSVAPSAAGSSNDGASHSVESFGQGSSEAADGGNEFTEPSEVRQALNRGT